MPNCSCGTVTRVDNRAVRKGQELSPNARQKGLQTATGQVGSANRALEKQIPAKDETVGHEADVAWTMAGSVTHFKLGLPHPEALARKELPVGRRRWWKASSKPHSLFRQAVVEPPIVGMEVDRSASYLPDLPNPLNVVDVSMSQPDLRDSPPPSFRFE